MCVNHLLAHLKFLKLTRITCEQNWKASFKHFCTPGNLNILYRLFMKFTQVKVYQDYDQFAIKPYVFLESHLKCFKLPC